MQRQQLIILFFSILFAPVFGQDITLFQQFNGRISYTAIGNTLNQAENGIDESFCEILPRSDADLNLSDTSNIIGAYLYWAGSGSGDQEVTLNDLTVNADILYNTEFDEPNHGILTYFSCFADITDIVTDLRNTTYTLSDLDISEALITFPRYCINRTNFAGWAIYIIYENESLPINQVSLFQGLEIINTEVREKIITIDNINVIDNEGAKIGFLAWEGDSDLSFNETLQVNENLIFNSPLNPVDNAFNGTNSFTNSSTFYNGDLDVYDIEDIINIGDTSMEIKLTTGELIGNTIRADLIILNNIITVFNSQSPDATITVDNYFIPCYSSIVELDYTVYNLNSNEILPSDTPIAFYANDVLVGQSLTQNEIPIDDSETGNITLTIPNEIPDDFTLTLVVDDVGNGSGIVIELSETNNNTTENLILDPIPKIMALEPLIGCDFGFNTANYDLTLQLELIEYNDINDLSFFETLDDLMNDLNEILNPENYQNLTDPQIIYIKQETDECPYIYQFDLITENCPPFIPQGFSPNGDGFNDWFNIQGLYDIFEKHELKIYNRYGTLIFVGDNSKRWEGKANRGLSNQGINLPVGTYFYVLNLNDANYKIITSWVYLNK